MEVNGYGFRSAKAKVQVHGLLPIPNAFVLSEVNVGSSDVHVGSSKVHVRSSDVHIGSSKVNLGPSNVNVQSSDVDVESSNVNVRSSDVHVALSVSMGANGSRPLMVVAQVSNSIHRSSFIS